MTPASAISVRAGAIDARMRFMRSRLSSTSPRTESARRPGPCCRPAARSACRGLVADGENGGDLVGRRRLQQQRRVALIVAAPFLEMRRDLVRVFAEALGARRVLQSREISVAHALAALRRARRRSLIASPRPLFGMGITAMARRRCIELAQHREEIGGSFLEIAVGLRLRMALRRGTSAPNASSGFAGLDVGRIQPNRARGA